MLTLDLDGRSCRAEISGSLSVQWSVIVRDENTTSRYIECLVFSVYSTSGKCDVWSVGCNCMKDKGLTEEFLFWKQTEQTESRLGKH